MIPILLEMFWIRRDIEFMVKEQAFEICASFLNKKQGKNKMLKDIDIVKSFCAIKDKDIFRKLEAILFFENDKDYAIVCNVSVIV